MELTKRLSLPLGRTLDRYVHDFHILNRIVVVCLSYESAIAYESSLMFRYEGLVLSVGGNGRSYVLILEAGPLADTSQSKLYFARISTKVGFCRVRIPFCRF